MIALADIAPAFSFIADRGFAPRTSAYNPQEFGNGILVMAGTPFSLRFVRDRDQVFVNIGDDTAGWHKLEYVLEFIDNSVTQQQLGEPPSPAILANLLHARWNNVVQLFNEPHKTLELEAFASEKSAALLRKIFGTP